MAQNLDPQSDRLPQLPTPETTHSKSIPTKKALSFSRAASLISCFCSSVSSFCFLPPQPSIRPSPSFSVSAVRTNTLSRPEPVTLQSNGAMPLEQMLRSLELQTRVESAQSHGFGEKALQPVLSTLSVRRDRGDSERCKRAFRKKRLRGPRDGLRQLQGFESISLFGLGLGW